MSQDAHQRVTALTTGKTRFKAVTFDLWQTLIFESEGASSMRSANRCQNVTETLNKFGFGVSLKKVTLAIEETINALLKLWDENKDVTHRDQLQSVVKYALSDEVKLKKEWVPELSSAYISSLFEIPPYLNLDAKKTLQWLQKQNMHIGLICNTGITPGFALRRFLSQIGIAEFFDSMIFSDEIGIRKPDPRIFRLAAKKLKTKSHEAIHIGDNLKTDVWGAKNAGFRAIHFASEEGRDKLTENDPASYLSRSRNLGKIGKQKLMPDATVNSLAMASKTIEKLKDLSK